MSHTTVFIFGQNGQIERKEEYRNSHTANVPWQLLWLEYMARPDPTWRGSSIDIEKPARLRRADKEPFPWSNGLRLKEFWKLPEDPRLAWFERAALRGTYDRCVVKRETFTRLADAYDAFTAKYFEGETPTVVWHLPAWAELLRKLADDETVRAIGWNQTSVGESLFTNAPKVCPTCDHEDEEGGAPYCLDTRSEHWYLDVEPVTTG